MQRHSTSRMKRWFPAPGHVPIVRSEPDSINCFSVTFAKTTGFGDSINSKAEILKAFRALFDNFETFTYKVTGLYPAADSDAVVVEYQPRATLVGGAVYTNSNIAVFHFKDGLISAYHDYFDPRRFQFVLDASRRVDDADAPFSLACGRSQRARQGVL
jgi:ketosteroid isomerase-like protein